MRHHWEKLGQIYVPSPSGRHPKLASHAANPLPIHIDGDIYRVFYSGRDEKNRSSIGAVDINLVEQKIINDHHQPFFTHGPETSFFADGVSIGNCYTCNGVRYMLFMGWHNPADAHWRGEIGRLVVTNELKLELDSMQPIMKRDEADPISLSYPWVHARQSSGFDMWYGSTLTWEAGNNEMLHVIKHASSANGHLWHRTGFSVPYAVGHAQAFSRPTVIQNEQGDFEMWFSYRSGLGEKYRIGYATSDDGLNWDLALNQTGITVSEFGWDSEMIEYPFVFDHKGRRYMLYNGNGYGKTGFGLAVLNDS